MAKSNYLEDKALDHFLGVSAYTMPSNVYGVVYNDRLMQEVELKFLAMVMRGSQQHFRQHLAEVQVILVQSNLLHLVALSEQ